jgi:hypothetical protein
MIRVGLRHTTWPAALVLAVAYALPVLVYLNRFLVPDYSYDTLNYHLFNGWRGASHFLPFEASEFFPATAATRPPFFDVLFVPTRLLLGYRVGTSLGLLAYLAAVFFLVRIARLLIPVAGRKINLLHAVVILYAATNLELLFQLATYFVDILDSAVLLASFYFLLLLNDALEHRKPWKRWFIATFCLAGASVFGKMTGPAFVGPELIAAAWLLLRPRSRSGETWTSRIGWLGLAVALTLGPATTIWVANALFTGNPLFPLFDDVFRSPYYTLTSLPGIHLGGGSLREKILWPIFSIWRPGGLAEPNGLFTDYKLTVTWLVAVSLVGFGLLSRRSISPALGITLFIYLSWILLWSVVLGGVARYASAALMLGALLLIPVVDHASWIVRWRTPRIAAASMVGAVLLFQVARVSAFDLKYDMSWRANFVHDRTTYLHQARFLFDSTEILPLRSDEIANIQIVVNCAAATSGYATVSALKEKPTVSIVENPIYKPITTNREYRKAVLRSLQSVYPGLKTFRFAALATNIGLDDTQAACDTALKDNGAEILSHSIVPEFLGERAQVLELTIGTITL